MQYSNNIVGLPVVTKNLIIINVLMFLAQNAFPDVTKLLALYPFQSGNFQPFQLVTHMFLHGDTMHLFFNMFTLFMFGRDLEHALGPKRFLFFYFLTGLGAAALHSTVWYFEVSHALAQSSPDQIAWAMDPAQPKSIVNAMALGASGAVYGLLAAFGMLYPNRMIMLLIPPIPMKAKYFVLIFGAIELYLGVSGTQTGVAHFAHLGGAIFGVLVILLWRRQGSRF